MMSTGRMQRKKKEEKKQTELAERKRSNSRGAKHAARSKNDTEKVKTGCLLTVYIGLHCG